MTTVRLPARISARRISARRLAAGLFAATTVYSAAALADNPLVQTSYTADPAPMVYEGRLYLYTSHDEDTTVNNFFTMNDWRLYSTVDMVNWTDHGSPAGYKSFSWGTGDAWAIQTVFRNGKFYLYAPINNSTGSKIGVLVGTSPTGPFSDPLGKALISTGSGNIDPTVFTDADGQAYLYWGNPDLYNVKLNSDMISFPGSPTKVNLTTAGFGVRTKTDRATAYEEGPWFYKRDALYYIVYPADSTPEKISFTTSDSPLGPWKYGGDIMDKETGSGSSFTNHPGVVDYKGHSYFFYHNAALPGGGGYKRSVCVEEFTYKPDGGIPKISMTTTGPKAVENLNPFQRVEAETIAFSSGLKTEVCSDTGGGMDVTQISSGDYIKVKNVAFGSGATSFDARVAAAAAGGSIELRLDSQTGTLIGTCAIAATGGAQTWATNKCTVTGATGVHDLFLKFTGGGFTFNWWQFSGPGSADVGTGGTGGGGASSSGGAGTIGGAGGQAGKPDGGSGVGGGLASGGTGGTASSTGGTAPSTGGSSSSSGSTSTGGHAPAGGSTGNSSGGFMFSGGKPPVEDSGCSCRSGAARGGSTPAVALLTLLAVILRRKRKTTIEN